MAPLATFFQPGAGWARPLRGEFGKPYMRWLDCYLSKESYYPSPEHLFEAFRMRLRNVRVVIVGQDPYYDGKATGLAFGVGTGTSRCLKAIDRELARDNYTRTARNDLTDWAGQGVLLLNTLLTVRQGGLGASHSGQGWEQFTDRVIEVVAATAEHRIIFCLWGDRAQHKTRLVNQSRHHLLPPTAHLTPRGRTKLPPFSGCGHFSQVNRLLRAQNLNEIVW